MLRVCGKKSFLESALLFLVLVVLFLQSFVVWFMTLPYLFGVSWVHEWNYPGPFCFECVVFVSRLSNVALGDVVASRPQQKRSLCELWFCILLLHMCTLAASVIRVCNWCLAWKPNIIIRWSSMRRETSDLQSTAPVTCSPPGLQRCSCLTEPRPVSVVSCLVSTPHPHQSSFALLCLLSLSLPYLIRAAALSWS